MLPLISCELRSEPLVTYTPRLNFATAKAARASRSKPHAVPPDIAELIKNADYRELTQTDYAEYLDGLIQQ